MVRRIAGDALADIGRLQGVVRLQPLLVEDEDVGEVVEQQRIGAIDLDLDGIVIDLARGFIGRQVAFQRRGIVGDARERGEHVVGREGVAIVEGDALAQVEAPGRRRHRLPGLRQRGLDLEVAGIAHQTFIDVVQHGQREGLAVGIGIERRNLAAGPPFQRLRFGCAAQREGSYGRQQPGLSHRNSPLLVGAARKRAARSSLPPLCASWRFRRHLVCD